MNSTRYSLRQEEALKRVILESEDCPLLLNNSIDRAEDFEEYLLQDVTQWFWTQFFGSALEGNLQSRPYLQTLKKLFKIRLIFQTPPSRMSSPPARLANSHNYPKPSGFYNKNEMPCVWSRHSLASVQLSAWSPHYWGLQNPSGRDIARNFSWIYHQLWWWQDVLIISQKHWLCLCLQSQWWLSLLHFYLLWALTAHPHHQTTCCISS